MATIPISANNNYEKQEKDDLIIRVNGILNKLSPDKLDSIVNEIISLKIYNEEIQTLIELFYDKAMDKPYLMSRLCHSVIQQYEKTPTQRSKFRSALINKNENEFTLNIDKFKTNKFKLQPIVDKIKMCKKQAERNELESLLYEEERKIKRRFNGTVRFIGELFKIRMLTGKIISQCIDMLLKAETDDSLECLCILLTIVGESYEVTINPFNKVIYNLNKEIARMEDLANKNDDKDDNGSLKISCRVRFMLQEVIDLRKNKWKPKHQNETEPNAQPSHQN